MRIVVLDGYTLNPGDLSWAGLDSCGPTTVYDRTPPELVVPRAREAEIILTNKTELPADVLGQLPRLRYVGVLATGHNVVDVAAARRQGVLVTNVPAYGSSSVAQMAMAHLLNLAVRVGHHAQGVADGRWSRNADFCYWDFPLVELDGLTLGIVGFGRIGRAVAGAAHALGMQILVYDPQAPTEEEKGDSPHLCAAPFGPFRQMGTGYPLGAFFRIADLDELFSTADVVSLHCPLTPETHRLVNADRLARMKPTAFLINTSRGPLVDEPALAEALNTGGLAGAGLDVLAVEPPPPDNPLLRAKNCYITPHIAWAAKASRQRLLDIAVGNVRAFLAGRPENAVG